MCIMISLVLRREGPLQTGSRRVGVEDRSADAG
jgi:hypothetical protein